MSKFKWNLFKLVCFRGVPYQNMTNVLLLSSKSMHNLCVSCATNRYITLFMRITELAVMWIINYAAQL